jgi:protein gp37
MAQKSSIEWTDATWNPITGCSVVSPGCTNCYAMKLAGTRLQHHPSRAGLTTMSKAGPVWNGKLRLNEEWLDQPLRWKRPRMIFVCAHGDLFHESVPDEWIDRIFAVMAMSPQHTFQVLTKRSARMRRYFEGMFEENGQFSRVCERMMFDPACQMAPSVKETCEAYGLAWKQPTCAQDWYPLPNVWLGVSAEDQARADERIPDLLATPAAIRFISAEPLLGPIDFYATSAAMLDAGHPWRNAPILHGIHWLIAGGESGQGARPMHPDWARTLRDQCAFAHVPFFFKQWGEWAAVSHMSEADIDNCYRPAPESAPEARRQELVESYVLHSDGSRHETTARNAFLAGTGAMTMFKLGKRRAGRLLDGVEHNHMPQPVEVPAL